MTKQFWRYSIIFINKEGVDVNKFENHREKNSPPLIEYKITRIGIHVPKVTTNSISMLYSNILNVFKMIIKRLAQVIPVSKLCFGFTFFTPLLPLFQGPER